MQELRTNKVRAMLTMLGVVIGSACIVLVVTVALRGRNYTSSARSKGLARISCMPSSWKLPKRVLWAMKLP